ncbi:MAG: nicotinate phosphoribosyltransferase [Nitrososphaerota archaeon]
MSGARRPRLYVAEPNQVKEGRTTDIYFQRTRAVLQETHSERKLSVAEAHTYGLPKPYTWAVASGIEEVAWLLEGLPVDVYAVEEGTIFRELSPILAIFGPYSEYGVYETSLLGILRHSSSVSTKAARVKLLASDKPVIFFGARCVHPTISPMVDRAAYMGGCDAVSSVLGADMIGIRPTGTMPHALILIVGDQAQAWEAFDSVMPPEVPRIALCDTLSDERFEALAAALKLGHRLYGVRLDTPSSRRGDMRRILEEVRWTLTVNGYSGVKIFVSGGVDEEQVLELRDWADGFGVGTSIAFPPSVDIALDIVEVDGKPFSKRGKLPGRKQVFRCPNLHDYLTPFQKKLEECPRCHEKTRPLLTPLISQGEIVRSLPSSKEIRDYVMEQLDMISRLGEFTGEPYLLP